MRVREIMTAAAEVVRVRPETTIAEAIRLLLRHGIGALPVVGDADAPVGLVAERDVVNALHGRAERVLDLPVAVIMRRPPPTCDAGADVRDVMARITRERLRHMIVCADARLAGMVSVGDLLKHRLDELELEASVLRDVVAAQRSMT
jgi:CBS domain-containing protein